ncbi:MAG: hypothetical protein IPP83_11645 [Flavobacteriales bacterium]|nr:hypothetical protein [Flavobacteriales bacterium]
MFFAVRFADERLYADSGYYLLRTINEGSFHIEHGRWVLAIAEAPALVASLLGTSMDDVIVVYSITNILFLALGIAYALFVLKDRRTALLLAMIHVIGLAHGLFCPVFELYYGVALLVLCFATVWNMRIRTGFRTVLSILFFIGALSSHPMVWALVLGAILLLGPSQRRSILRPAVVIMIAFAVFRGFTMSAYEAGQLAFLQRFAFPSLVVGLFTPDVLMEQARRIILHYPDVLVLSTFCVVVLWRNRQRRAAIIHLLGLFALYLAVGLYLPEPTHDRYREQVDFAFTAWTMIVILLCVWEITAWRPALLVLLVACVGFRLAYIGSIAPSYSARTAWEKELIDRAREHGMHKAIIDPMNTAFGTLDDRVAPYWSTGFETLLLSAKEGSQRVVSVITTDDAAHFKLDEYPGIVVLRWDQALEPAELNMRYFDLPQGSYVSLSMN